MVDQLVKANINLHAVLRNLEDLCELDSEMNEMIKDKDIAIQFIVKNGPRAHVSFSNGQVSYSRGNKRSDIKLYFRSPKHLNDMFDDKANPIPLKGFLKIKFLTNQFTKLTDQLAYYLKPTDKLLENPYYFKMNAYLTAYTAFHALAEIGNHDRIGKLNASRIPDGIIFVEVMNGPAVQLSVDHGVLTVSKQTTKTPRASMVFKNLEVASGILNGQLDTYTCLGSGDFEVRGYLPMIDNMNKLLIQVPNFLR